MQSVEGLGNTFSRSWELLTENWILLLPGIAIGIIAAVIVFLLVSFGLISGAGLSSAGLGVAGIGAAALAGLVAGLVALVAAIVTIAYTTGMAGAAWRTGRASLDDGAAAFRKDGASILVAMVLLAIIGLVAIFLSLFTFGLALLLFMLFFMYTFASTIVGERSGAEALGDSARIAARNFGMSLAILVILACLYLVAGWLGGLLGHVPLLGKIVALVIQQIASVYATLVIVGEYIKLSGRVPAAAPPSAGPPAAY